MCDWIKLFIVMCFSYFINMQINQICIRVWNYSQTRCSFQLVFHCFSKPIHLTTIRCFGRVRTAWIVNEFEKFNWKRFPAHSMTICNCPWFDGCMLDFESDRLSSCSGWGFKCWLHGIYIYSTGKILFPITCIHMWRPTMSFDKWLSKDELPLIL